MLTIAKRNSITDFTDTFRLRLPFSRPPVPIYHSNHLSVPPCQFSYPPTTTLTLFGIVQSSLSTRPKMFPFGENTHDLTTVSYSPNSMLITPHSIPPLPLCSNTKQVADCSRVSTITLCPILLDITPLFSGLGRLRCGLAFPSSRRVVVYTLCMFFIDG